MAAIALLAQVGAFLCANLLACLTAAVIAFLLYADLCRRLPVRHLPQPDTHWPVVGQLFSLLPAVIGGSHHELLRQNAAAQDFKTWARWAPTASEIILSDPDNLRHMFNTNFTSYELPAKRRKCFADALGDGIFNSDGARWKEQRAYASHLFSAAQLRRRMLDVFQAHSRKVKSLLECKAPGEVFDLQALMYSYTFDAICEIAFGLPVDSLGGNQSDLDFQGAFDRVQARAMTRIFELGWEFKRLLGLGAEKAYARDIACVNRYIDRILSLRKEGDAAAVAAAGAAESADVLSIFWAHCQETGRQTNREELRSLIKSFIIAGRDTTACALTWTFWELSRDPEAYAKVVADIRQNADPDNMQYTQAVFQEVLRLHPSVPVDFKECVRNDVLPDGTKVYKGTLVHFSPCVITRNPKYYPDPDSFRPTRWTDDEGRCRKYDQYSYPCFNAGPRICLGRHMSPLELKVLLSELLGDLSIDVVPGFKPEILTHPVLLTRNGMAATVSKRPREQP